MLKFIGIVAELFHELIADSSYHVDKICFIKIIFEENTLKAKLVPDL